MLPFIVGIQIFFIVFARMIALFSSTTFWGSNLILLRYRILVAFFTTVLLFPMLREIYVKFFPLEWEIFWFLVIQNVLIGLLFGFLISMFFSLFQIAGQLMSFQMGFSISQVLDPLSQEEMPLIGQTFALLVLLVFIALNGHLTTIDVLYQSFKKIPILNMDKTYASILDKTLSYFGFMFAASLQFSMIIVGSIFIATLFIGLLSKASPQINAMIFGFPLYIASAFFLLSFLAGNIITFAGNYINNFFSKIFAIFVK